MLVRSIISGLGVAAAVLLGGCANGGCPTSCAPKFLDKCHEFFSTADPCKDGVCTLAEQEMYGKLGYECAKARGMVPIDPKYGLPAIDCPVEYSVDATAKCLPPCAGIPEHEQGPVAQAGFLITAYDTVAGTVYVMVDAEKDYDPKANLAEAGTGLNEIARRLSTTNGAVAVYLTEYPLIAADSDQQSRQPRESEIDILKQNVQSMGKTLNELKIVRWK